MASTDGKSQATSTKKLNGTSIILDHSRSLDIFHCQTLELSDRYRQSRQGPDNPPINGCLHGVIAANRDGFQIIEGDTYERVIGQASSSPESRGKCQ
jgi:hypothetical protein